MGKVHFTNMIKIAIFSVLLFSLVVASPMSTKDRGLIDDLLSGDLSASGSAESEEPKDSDSLTDLLLGLIQQIVLQQINSILGISAPTTTTTTTTTTTATLAAASETTTGAAGCGPLGLVCG